MYRLVFIPDRRQFLVIPIPPKHPRRGYVSKPWPAGKIQRWRYGKLQKSKIKYRHHYRLFSDQESAIETGRLDLWRLDEQEKKAYSRGERFRHRGEIWLARSDAAVGRRIADRDLSNCEQEQTQ